VSFECHFYDRFALMLLYNVSVSVSPRRHADRAEHGCRQRHTGVTFVR